MESLEEENPPNAHTGEFWDRKGTNFAELLAKKIEQQKIKGLEEEKRLKALRDKETLSEFLTKTLEPQHLKYFEEANPQNALTGAGLNGKETLPEFLTRKIEQQVRKEDVIFATDSIKGEHYMFSHFPILSGNVASSFYKKGMRKGDVVVYLCYDLVKLHILFNGIWRANGTARSTYGEELEDSILSVVVESKSKWIVCERTDSEKCLSVAKKVQWPVEVIVMGYAKGCTSIYNLLTEDDSDCPPLEIGPDDPALILATSGTTGKSKGAVHTHKSLIAAIQKLQMSTPLKDSPNLCLSKGTHISAVLFGLMILASGKPGVFMCRITLDNIISAVKKYKPGYVFAFPTFLLALASDPRLKDSDKESIESMHTTGTTIHPSVEVELRSMLPNLKTFSIMYALTEVAPVTTTTMKPSDDENKEPELMPGVPSLSIGKPYPGTSIQIRDTDTGEILDTNQQGEICIKSNALFSHYLHQPEETTKSFDADGWFLSGDIGYIDENGFVFHVGRYKEMFKCGGNHIYPAQIDEVISRHPDVVNVCTIGIAEGTEKIPRAFVVLKPDAKSTDAEILQFANENLPTYKHLTGGVYIVPDLPRGATGKVTRKLVEQLSSELVIKD